MDKVSFLKKYELIELTDKDNFILDIKYATKDNFIGKAVYKEPICILRKKTAEKLINANKALNQMGYKIKIWDAFRPLIYQELMWKIYPDERFVTNPKKGNSNHCKASAVDITICDINGNELKMPTKFDHFGEESFRKNYILFDEEVKNNVKLLEKVMFENGFIPFETEWWHFNDSDDYDVITEMYEK